LPIPSPLRRAFVGLLLLGCALVAPVEARPGSRPEGERIRFTGYVTDPAGKPLPGITVVLEFAREGFDVRSFSRKKTGLTRLTTVSNEQGEYSIEWPWNAYYNSLVLIAGLPVRRPDGERLKELERVDVSQRSRRGNPIVTALVVSDLAFVESVRTFLASIRSEDQRRTYQEAGAPDKVDRLQHSDHEEAAWWYFELGRVYRFRDGRLDKIEPFDPVKPF
jgi:hypothetical protein